MEAFFETSSFGHDREASVETPADDALKYWTADKMRNAKAAPLPNVNTLERGKQHPRRPTHSSDPHQA